MEEFPRFDNPHDGGLEHKQFFTGEELPARVINISSERKVSARRSRLPPTQGRAEGVKGSTMPRAPCRKYFLQCSTFTSKGYFLPLAPSKPDTPLAVRQWTVTKFIFTEQITRRRLMVLRSSHVNFINDDNIIIDCFLFCFAMRRDKRNYLRSQPRNGSRDLLC